MIPIKENDILAKYTSLHVGGPARFLISVTTDDALREALQFAGARKLPFIVLGKGSNTLFSDQGYNGVVIVMADRRMSVDATRLVAASGVFMRPLVNTALSHELRGLEDLAGIPGTVGGAVRGNAGTWHTEMKDVLERVEVMMPEGNSWKLTFLTVDECQFGYRDSIFKRQPDWVIVRAHFLLHKGDRKEGELLIQKDHEQRHLKQPYDAPSAGSIFKNPDKERGVYAGALIEKAGLKGKRLGGAEISTKHANFILNRGKATSQDIQGLMHQAQIAVKNQFNIDLEPEIVVIK